MSDQNSSTDNIVRPEDLMAELDLKKSTYYDDLNYLNISANKDENKKAYLTIDQANQVRALRSYVIENGKRDGFNYGGLAVSNNNELATNSESNDIYINREEPIEQFDTRILREAEELAARGMAMKDLIKIQLASQMSFDDLSPDLQEKVNIAREVANPKYTPATIASQLLTQYRNQKAQVEG
ncbi:MAG: hypothetical protein RLZZ381_398 [Cyanobacteriota bacterium]|jgi:hypothetical protein